MLSINRYRAVCFDLFHTLVDVAAAPGASGRYTADILGVDRGDWNRLCFSELHDITGPTRHLDVVRRLAHALDPAIPHERIAEATEERQRRFDHALEQVAPLVTRGLQRLRDGGVLLALVSNASSGEVRAWRRSPLAELFDTVVFSCDCGYRKPQPEIYHLALERLGVNAPEALFVGDGGSDEHRGAAAVGLTTVLTTQWLSGMDGARLAQRRAAAEHAVGGLDELITLFFSG